MEYRNLGASGLEVSRIGLGTIPFGTALDDKQCSRLLSSYVDLGGNFLDTANIYGGGKRGEHSDNAGRAEEAVGRAIAGRRSELVIATKGFWVMEDEVRPNSVGLSRRYLTQQIDASLKRLGSDWIDLYQCHAYDFYTPLDETLRALDDAVTAGKIRYVGVSNWDGWHVVKANAYARNSGLEPIVSNQVWYNLIDRTVENSVGPACADQGVGVIAWGIVANGFLSGRYSRDQTTPQTGRFKLMQPDESASWERIATERNWAILDSIKAIAADYAVPPSAVAAAWVLKRGSCDAVLLGGSSAVHYEDQLKACELEIAPELLDQLDRLSKPDKPYPINFLSLFARRHSPAYGGLR